MCTAYLQSRKSIYHVMLLSLGTIILGSCSRSHQLGVETNQQDILDMRLANPSQELSTTQSIALIEHCAQLGEQNAEDANNKEAITILGETGTGKSTSINHWMGCQMELRTPEELGVQGVLEEVIVVSPDSDQPEATSIGHRMVSHTFMPQIIQDPDCNTRVYLDCPGFSDTRGAEINIANAINTRRVLQQARGVKAVFLTNYRGLSDERGNNIRAIERMCSQMFGGIDNLENHKDAILIGINRAPLQTRLHRIRAHYTQIGSPSMKILANRTFLYDPLGRGGEDFWSREQFLEEIRQMPCIPQEVASNMFQTVLTDSDKTALQRIVTHQVNELGSALEQSDYPAASRCWNLIKQLRIIEHGEIAELMEGQVIRHMRTYAAERTATFNEYASQHNFTEAERLLALLRSLYEHFPDENLVDLDNLDATLNTTREQHTAQQEAQEEIHRAQEEIHRAQEKTHRAEEKTHRAQEETRRTQEEIVRERRAREEMGQRINNLEHALEEERRKNRRNDIWGVAIMGTAHVLGKAIERKE